VRVCNEIPKPKIVLVAGVGHALSFQDVIVEAQDYDLVRYVATQESLILKDADLRFLRTDMAESVMTVPCQKDAISTEYMKYCPTLLHVHQKNKPAIWQAECNQ
jgi:hypothetical protein